MATEKQLKYWESKKGKKANAKTKEKMRLARTKRKENLGYINSPEAREKLRIANLGKKQTLEHRLHNSISHIGLLSGDKHPQWLGGISNDPYPQDWNEILKNSIRCRDNYVCQICGTHQDELTGIIKKLHVHHVDYNKENLDPKNLISLCPSCHMKTNFNREWWIKYFNNLNI